MMLQLSILSDALLVPGGRRNGERRELVAGAPPERALAEAHGRGHVAARVAAVGRDVLHLRPTRKLPLSFLLHRIEAYRACQEASCFRGHLEL